MEAINDCVCSCTGGDSKRIRSRRSDKQRPCLRFCPLVWLAIMAMLCCLPGAKCGRIEMFTRRSPSGDADSLCRDNTVHCPPMSADIIAINTGPSSVSLKWSYVTNSSSTLMGRVRIVRVRVRAFNYMHHRSVDRVFRSNTTNCTIDGLSRGTRYQVWLITENGNGLNIGSKQTFSTPEYISLTCQSMTSEKQGCVHSGASADFKCQVRGGPHLSISWDSVPGSLVRQKAVTGGHDVLFSFNNVTLRDNGRRYCVNSTTKTMSRKACFQLCVKEAIQISCRRLKPCARRHMLLQKVTVSCSVSGYPTPAVSWHFNGRQVTNTDSIERGNDWHLLPRTSAEPRDMNFDFVPRSAVYRYRIRTNLAHGHLHTGRMEVRVSNDLAAASKTQDIIITEDHTEPIRVISSHDKMNLGDNFMITCKSFIGVSAQNFNWYFQPAHSSHSSAVLDGRNGVKITTQNITSQLQIPAANITHSGRYRCVVENENGCEVSSYTDVKVHAPLVAEISSDDGFITHSLHRPATVSCSVNAAVTNEPPVVRWFLNSHEIRPDYPEIDLGSLTDMNSMMHSSSWRAQISPSYVRGHQYRFDITSRNLTITDLGELTCKVSLRGKKHSSSAKVLATGALVVITDSPRVVRVKQGARADITCLAFSDGPQYSHDIEKVGWLARFKRSMQSELQVLPARDQHNIRIKKQSSTPKHAANVFIRKATLTITNFNARNQGFYVCRAPADPKRRPSGARMQAVVRLKLDRRVSTKATDIMFDIGKP